MKCRWCDEEAMFGNNKQTHGGPECERCWYLTEAIKPRPNVALKIVTAILMQGTIDRAKARIKENQ